MSILTGIPRNITIWGLVVSKVSTTLSSMAPNPSVSPIVLILSVLLIFSSKVVSDPLGEKCTLPFADFRRTFSSTVNFRVVSVEDSSWTNNRSSSDFYLRDASRNRSYPSFPGAKELTLVHQKAVFPKLPMLPPFAPINAAKSELCRNHSRIFLEEVEELRMWALKMYDASAKIPSGLLNGNVNQYGDFDQCIGVEELLDQNKYLLEDNQLLGKYCLSYIDTEGKHNLQHSEFMELLQSHYMIRSNTTDPGHRLPRFSSVNWAFCIPSSCSANDLEAEVRGILDTYTADYGIKLSVKVDPEMCYTKESWKESLSITTIFCFLLLAGLVLLTFFATAIDQGKSFTRGENSLVWKTVGSFSLKSNIRQLFSLSAPADDIESIHGIRFLNSIALLLCHKSMSMLFNPFMNRTSMTEALSYKWTVIARTAIIYTDAFIMISGILAAYGFVKDLDKKGKLDIKRKYITRAIRLTPNLLAIILLCTYIIVPLGSGPQWNMVVKHHSTLCKSFMWRNLLYIHNYFGFEEMCLTHTHQLGLDMQLFLVSPVIVYLLWRWTNVGFIVCMMLGFISTAMRYIATYNLRLSPLIYFGTSVSQLFATANNSYILPTHRLTSYLFGIGMGFYLRRMGKNSSMTKFQVFMGWSTSLAMGLWAMMGPMQITSLNYVYKEHDGAFYMAFSPIMWCIFVGWVIFATKSGYGGFFGHFLSWNGFVVFTRIAYAVYLVQFPVYFYNVGRKRGADFYDTTEIFNIMEMSAVFIASIALTLVVDLPAQNLRKIFFPDAPPTKKNEDVIPAEEAKSIEKTPPNSREVISGADTRRRAVG